ncbi:photosystem II protein Y [Chitinophaga sp. ysch24]|uniref:Photosystem II protein Y n=1 Tax=Chitinophaga tropicalis TaxID=2683588 RepID=A0A7K1U953_9BACT|nr:photosystem II protein Y [Chitinophaga tropicalis]
MKAGRWVLRNIILTALKQWQEMVFST